MPSMARIMPIGGNGSTSAPVTTATTPGAFRAASTSSAATRAWACGLRTKTTWVTPSRRRSSRKRPSPRRSGGSSRRRAERPTWVMAPDCTITPMPRAWGGFALAAALLASAPDAAAQVFVAESSRPDFTIGPLFVVATAPADVNDPVNVSVSWNVVGRDGHAPGHQDLLLLWPAEIATATAQGAADTALLRYVDTHGYSAISSGRLTLRARATN